MAEWASWPEIQDMSLDDVDLQALFLEAIEHAEPDDVVEVVLP